MKYKTSVIIAAAGSSVRMGGGLPKQYRMCKDLPVLVKSAKVFCACRDIDEIIVSVPAGDVPFCKAMFERYGAPGCRFTEGGAERPASVLAALRVTAPDSDFVLVHDGARPFVTEALAERVLDALRSGASAAVPCVRPNDTIRTQQETLDRSKLFAVQTPQGFRRDVLIKAYESAAARGAGLISATDDISLTERIGVKTVIVEGDPDNIKITTPKDLPRSVRTGIGYDVHKLVPGRPLMLGCIEIPYEMGLLGHSDADVIAHAIADALLGASALGDIGKHFPDNSPACLGMSGSALLKKTAGLVKNAGFTIINTDVTLVAEKPKVSKYTGQMQEAIAAALGIEPSCVGVKATTEEGLGISGAGTAMSAYAVATID